MHIDILVIYRKNLHSDGRCMPPFWMPDVCHHKELQVPWSYTACRIRIEKVSKHRPNRCYNMLQAYSILYTNSGWTVDLKNSFCQHDDCSTIHHESCDKKSIVMYTSHVVILLSQEHSYLKYYGYMYVKVRCFRHSP